MANKMKIVGIAGLPRSGKDSLAEMFIEKGWFGVSLGDIVRNHSRVRHADKADPISVANMTETANWLRSENGADFAIKSAIEQFNSQKAGQFIGLVVFSVRAPIEVDYIIREKGELIWVEAEDEVRYRRAMANLRDGEQVLAFDDFLAPERLQEQPQPGIPREVQMNTTYVKQKATIVLENNSDNYQEFADKANKIVQQLSY